MPTKTWAISKDAYYRTSDGNWHNDNDTLLAGIQLGSLYRSVLQFSLSWSGVRKIVSAELHIRQASGAASAQTVVISRVVDSWSESSGPVPGAVSSGQVTANFGSTGGWKTADITAIVEAWAPASVLKSGGGAGGGESNYGIRIRNNDESNDLDAFYSRETAYDAYITLTYLDNLVPNAPTTLRINDLVTGSVISGAADPVFKATHSDGDSDPIDRYQIYVDATTGNGIQPDWTSAIFSATITAPDASISGNNITKTLTGISGSWVRGQWYCVRVRTNDDISGWGPFSYLWFKVNQLPTTGLTEPSATGRLGKVSLTPGLGWASPRLNVAWSYADSDGQAQTKYTLEVANDTAGSPGSTIVSGDVTSGAASVVCTPTLTEGNYYHVRVRVFDGVEWSAFTSWVRIRVRWGLSTHSKDVNVSGAAPTSWQVTSLLTTSGASSAVVIEYNSSDDGTANLAATWTANLDSLVKRKWVHYRVWLLSWGASPATSPSLDKIVVQTSGLAAVPDYWSPTPISGVGGSIELSTHAFGSQCLRVDGNSTSRVVYQSIPLDPNTDYVLQARVKSIGNSGAKVVLSDTNDGASPVLATTAVTADRDWELDTGATYFNSGARTSIFICCIVTGASGTSGMFDGTKVERGRVTSPWSPGFVGDPVVLDAGGVQVDASASGVFRLRGSSGGTNDRVDLGNHGLELNGFGIGSGSTFPTGNLTAGDRWFRTDQGREFFYDGTRWLCTCLHYLVFPNEVTNLTANSADISRVAPIALLGGSDVWVEDLDVGYHVASGTALSASHKWTVNVQKFDTAGGATTIVTKTIDSGASAVWRRDAAQAVDALLSNPGAVTFFRLVATKTGTPGNLFFYPVLSYRIVAT